MSPQNKKQKAEYGVIAVYLRGDRDYVDQLKSRAAIAHKPLSDFIRDNLDKAIACDDSIFFADSGKDRNQGGKA